jgi:sec-independent protein translocase protein TatB
MDIFGIGPTEIVFIILLALILLGPKEMEKTGRTIGRFLRDLTRSEGWRAFRDTSRELRNLPNRLMREANIEDLQKEVGEIGKDVSKIGKEIEESATVKGFGTWSNPSAAKSRPPQPGPRPAEASNKPAVPSESPSPVVKESREPDKDA